MDRPHSSGITRRRGGTIPFKNGHVAVIIEGRLVAQGSEEAMVAAARLLEVTGVACISPNGRTDRHGAYVETGPGNTRCAFCKEPI